jgi:phosphatidylinositol-4,5-bisphosphate 3-kinase
MAYVIGGKDSDDFAKFVQLCCKGYNILRKSGNIFMNLFAMMLSTGIPELSSAEDLDYLRDAFALHLSEVEATKKFTELIHESLTTKMTQLNNAIHILAHSKK